MLRDMQEQPEVLGRLLSEGQPEVERAAEAIRARKVNYVQLAARGSSDNAARYGQYLFGALNRLAAGLATPSLYTVYGTPPQLGTALVLGLSQSGQSPDVAEVLESARRAGALTLAITNYPDSPLGRVAEYLIWLRAGEESSIPATKTYTAQLLALAMLSTALAGQTNAPRLAELQAVPQMVADTMRLQSQVESVVEGYRDADRMVVIGRGFNFATAHEIALKLQESAYVMALAFSSADFRHGPLSLVEPGLPALVIAPSGQVQDELLALARDLEAWGARVIVIGDPSLADLRLPTLCLRTPVTVSEWLSPLPVTVIGQMFALALANAKGLNPDRPRRLQKITATH
jgi:glucosamine--fructose-6-phosphate aminotransferase (isomerizing)